MVNTLPSKTKDTLCIYYSRPFLPVPFGLAAAEAASCLSFWVWLYCYAAQRGGRHQKRKIHYASIILARSCQCRLDWRRRSRPPACHCGCGSIASPLAEIAWGVESRWAARWLTDG